jgi:hypothetical protein
VVCRALYFALGGERTGRGGQQQDRAAEQEG